RIAAAVPPAKRPAWGTRLGALLVAGMDAPVLQVEAALGQLALAWAATSSYPSDVLFSAEAGGAVDLLVVLEGFQAEPVTGALKEHFGAKALSMSLNLPAGLQVP